MTRDRGNVWSEASIDTRDTGNARAEASQDTRELQDNWSQLPQARVSNAEWLLSPVDTHEDTWHQFQSKNLETRSQSSSNPHVHQREPFVSLSKLSRADRRESQTPDDPRSDWSLGSSISRVWAELPQARVTRGNSYTDGYFQYLNVPAHKVNILNILF